MRFRLVAFGELSLYQGDSSAKVALPRKALAILAILAANGGKPVTRDRLVALLWPEAGGAGASGRGALKTAIYELRQALGTADAVAGTAELSLDPAIITSDVAELEAAHVSRDFRTAAEVYRGKFLDAFQLRDSAEFEHWVDARRAHYARIFREAVEGLAADAAFRGNRTERLSLLKRLASAEPLDGKVAAMLIDAMADAGDRTGALSHFQQHEKLLREELDVAPEPQAVAAAERIRRSMSPTDYRLPSTDPRVPQADRLPSTDPPSTEHRLPSTRNRPLLVGIALTIPIVAIAATFFTRPPLRVIRTIELEPTAAVRLTMLPQLNTLYMDAGARFDAQLMSLLTANDSLTHIGLGSGVAADPSTHWIWSGDYTGHAVIVRNGRTNLELARIPVPGCPHSFAIAREWMLVGQQCEDHISIIDRNSRRPIRHIPVPTLTREEVGGAKGMGEIIVNRATGIAYFAKDNIPHRLDPATGAIRETPDFDGHVIGVNEVTNRLYVRGEHTVRIFDGATERLLAEVPLSATPGRAAIGLAGDRVFVTTDSGLAVLDGTRDRLLYEASLGRGYRPDAIALDVGQGRAYVAGTDRAGARTLRIVALRD